MDNVWYCPYFNLFSFYAHTRVRNDRERGNEWTKRGSRGEIAVGMKLENERLWRGITIASVIFDDYSKLFA